MYGYGYRFAGSGSGLANPFKNEYSLNLNGTTQAVNADSWLDLMSDDTASALSGWAKVSDLTPPSGRMLFSAGDTNADEFIYIWLTTTGKIQSACKVAGVVQWNVATDNTLPDEGLAPDRYFCWTLSHNGTEAQISINGYVLDQTFGVSTDKTAWFADCTGLDNVRFGALNWNNNGDSSLLAGKIDEYRYYSSALSLTDIGKIYSGGTPQKNEVSSFEIECRFGDIPPGRDWNTTVANEWYFIDGQSGKNCQTINGLNADVQSDVPDSSSVPLLLVDGNSLPFRSRADVESEVVSQYGVVGTDLDYRMLSVGGQYIDDMLNDINTDVLLKARNRDNKYIIVHEIRNQLILDDASTTFSKLVDYCTQCSNAGFKVIVVQTSEAVYPATTGPVQTGIPTVNTSIANDTSGIFNVKVDLYNHTTVNGDFGDSTSGVFDPDKVHYSALGEADYASFLISTMATTYPTL
jgi:hypothetical protein